MEESGADIVSYAEVFGFCSGFRENSTFQTVTKLLPNPLFCFLRKFLRLVLLIVMFEKSSLSSYCNHFFKLMLLSLLVVDFLIFLRSQVLLKQLLRPLK